MGEEVEDDLSALAKLDAARTQGPWELKEDIDSDVWAGDTLILSDTQYYPTAPGIEDIRFIVSAANAIPSLIAEVRRLRTSLTRAEEALREIADNRSTCGEIKTSNPPWCVRAYRAHRALEELGLSRESANQDQRDEE